jgi:hypothetical protein
MPHRRLAFVALLLLPALGAAAACGSSSNQTPDAGSDAGSVDTGADAASGDGSVPTESGAEAAVDSGILGANCPPFDAGTPFVEATHGPLPTMAYFGGPLLTAAQIITFTFSDTPGVPTLQSFGQTVTQTPWFAEVTKDYCINDGGTCIGPGPAGVSIALPAAADATYVDTFGFGSATGGTDLEAFINAQIAAAVTAKTIPAPGPNSLYAFYFPPTTTIWMGPVNQGSPSCGTAAAPSWEGYHSAMTYTDGTTPIVYAILPDCSSGDPVADLEGVTIAASHEVVEAVTDPGSNNTLSWYLDQPMTADAGITVNQFRNDPWGSSEQFQEVADNCESILLQDWQLDSGTYVQRIWSTSAAALGHNPCVPVPTGEAYYNASTDKALYVANVGDTFTVDVSAFSDMARSSWRLDAIDNTPTQLTDSAMNPLPYLKVEFVNGVANDPFSSLICVNNGSTGQLKVTLLADPDNDQSLQQLEWPEADGVVYSVDLADPVSYTTQDGGPGVTYPYQFWPFAVITPATAATLGVTSAGIADVRKLAALRARHHAQHAAVRKPTLLQR